MTKIKEIPEPRGIEKKSIQEQVNQTLKNNPLRKVGISMIGIEQLSEALRALCKLVTVLRQAKENDGKITLTDAFFFHCS